MDDGRNVGVRFIEPTGKLPKRKEVLAEIVRSEEFYESGPDESDPYRVGVKRLFATKMVLVKPVMTRVWEVEVQLKNSRSISLI